MAHTLLEANLTNNSYRKYAIAYIEKKFNLNGKECFDKFQNIIRNAVSRVELLKDCTNNISSGFFALGIVRLFCEDANFDKNIMDEILIRLTQSPNYLIDNNFNNVKNLKTLCKKYFPDLIPQKKQEEEWKNEIERVAANEDGKHITIGDYTIYNAFTYDTMEKFIKLEAGNSICYVGDMKSFYRDEGEWGLRAKYACLNKNYRTVTKDDINSNYPYDPYGMSLIIISVDKNGNLSEVCSRWNNGYRSQDIKSEDVRQAIINAKHNFPHIATQYMDKKSVEKYILNGQYKFEDIFKPFTEISYNSRLENVPALQQWYGDINKMISGKSAKDSASIKQREYSKIAPSFIEKYRIAESDSKKTYKITESQLREIIKESLNKTLNEMQAQHISPNDFDEFKLDASTWGTGEKSGISHGYGIYVAIDPYSGGRYVKSALKDNNNPQAFFYDVDIPDFNGHNYILMHGSMDKSEFERINDIFKQTFNADIILKETSKAKRGGILNGFNVMNCIDATISKINKQQKINKSDFFGGKMPTLYNATRFLLEKCGYVGAMYNGRSDRMCAFIFDPSLIKINRKINVNSLIDIKPFEKDSQRDSYKNDFMNTSFYKERQKNYYDKYPNENPDNPSYQPDYFKHKSNKH